MRRSNQNMVLACLLACVLACARSCQRSLITLSYSIYELLQIIIEEAEIIRCIKLTQNKKQQKKQTKNKNENEKQHDDDADEDKQ